MLHYFLIQYIDQFPILNLFRYITFRTGGAIFTSLILCFLFGEKIIAWLKSIQNEGQPIRDYLHNGNLEGKKGTPTMGGIMILGSFIISSILWTDIKNIYVWVVLFVALGFGLLGFFDDYAKLTKKTHAGVRGKVKLFWQLTISLIAIYFISNHLPQGLKTHLAVPFFKNYLIDLSYFFFIFTAFVLVGASNAVNLTDGLDGLAIVPVIIAVCCFGLISYLAGNAHYSSYLQIHAVPDAGEISVICGAIMGAGLGFLWYNAPPAQVFMGDTGSLSLGGILGTISVITKHEIVLAIIGGLFVMETMSVIIQVFYFKRTGKRVFLMSPIHHHFEKKGWRESKIVIRFWILAIIFALIGLSTLKLR
jgi:phospho-N-acetylmuramoyl-pentapeptide-transferase